MWQQFLLHNNKRCYPVWCRKKRFRQKFSTGTKIGAHFLHKFNIIGTICCIWQYFVHTWQHFLKKFGTINSHSSVNLNQEQERKFQKNQVLWHTSKEITQEGCKFNFHADRAMETLGTWCIWSSNCDGLQ